MEQNIKNAVLKAVAERIIAAVGESVIEADSLEQQVTSIPETREVLDGAGNGTGEWITTARRTIPASIYQTALTTLVDRNLITLYERDEEGTLINMVANAECSITQVEAKSWRIAENLTHDVDYSNLKVTQMAENIDGDIKLAPVRDIERRAMWSQTIDFSRVGVSLAKDHNPALFAAKRKLEARIAKTSLRSFTPLTQVVDYRVAVEMDPEMAGAMSQNPEFGDSFYVACHNTQLEAEIADEIDTEFPERENRTDVRALELLGPDQQRLVIRQLRSGQGKRNATRAHFRAVKRQIAQASYIEGIASLPGDYHEKVAEIAAKTA